MHNLQQVDALYIAASRDGNYAASMSSKSAGSLHKDSDSEDEVAV